MQRKAKHVLRRAVVCCGAWPLASTELGPTPAAAVNALIVCLKTGMFLDAGHGGLTCQLVHRLWPELE